MKAATHGHGADVILDIIGAKYLEPNVRALAVGGRLVVIGLQGGVRGELDLGQLLRNQGTIAATSLRFAPADVKAEVCAQVVAQVWPMISDGTITPVIDRVVAIAGSRPPRRAGEQRQRREGAAAGGGLMRRGSLSCWTASAPGAAPNRPVPARAGLGPPDPAR